jgi:hypothetical protein
MNMEIGTVVTQFFFWEYLFPILGIGFLQCTMFTLLTSFKPLLLKGGGVKSISRGDCEYCSKEENF